MFRINLLAYQQACLATTEAYKGGRKLGLARSHTLQVPCRHGAFLVMPDTLSLSYPKSADQSVGLMLGGISESYIGGRKSLLPIMKSRPNLEPDKVVTCFWCSQEITSETEVSDTSNICPNCGQDIDGP